MELRIGRGRGYVPAEENTTADQPIGTIALDAIYNPIRKVNYTVENTVSATTIREADSRTLDRWKHHAGRRAHVRGKILLGPHPKLFHFPSYVENGRRRRCRRWMKRR